MRRDIPAKDQTLQGDGTCENPRFARDRAGMTRQLPTGSKGGGGSGD
jgi:hypothetical protein